MAAINAQELDETFMSSLPDELKKDVLNRANSQNQNTDDLYNSYQYSSKLEQKEDMIRSKKQVKEPNCHQSIKKLINVTSET